MPPLLCRLPRSAPALFAQPSTAAMAAPAMPMPAGAAGSAAAHIDAGAAAFAAAARQHPHQQALAGRLVSSSLFSLLLAKIKLEIIVQSCHQNGLRISRHALPSPKARSTTAGAAAAAVITSATKAPVRFFKGAV